MAEKANTEMKRTRTKALAQAAGRRNAKRKKPKLTPFEEMFPPIKDRKLPKDGAAYL